MGAALSITDRGYRYRANQAMPQDAPRVCSFCGGSNVEVGHLDGHEENNEPWNLTYTCRPCNVIVGRTLQNANLGRLTRQYNPAGGFNPALAALSLPQYRAAVSTLLSGQAKAQQVRQAISGIQGTSHKKRAEHARKLNPAKKTGRRTAGPPNYAAYMAAVAEHRPGAHDAAGKVIHATPRYLREQYAADAWNTRRERYGDRGRNPGSSSNGKILDFARAFRGRYRKNPAAAAAEAFELFHGFPPSEFTVVEKMRHVHEHVWQLGALHEILIVPNGEETPEGHRDRCIALRNWDGARLTANEKRNQLFVDDGDQALDDRLLERFGLKLDRLHEDEMLGKAVAVTYDTNKTHLVAKDGGQGLYEHKFGEILVGDERVFTGKISRPFVRYDTVNQEIYFVGGAYEIPAEGISD